jgi:hypothetical protein
LRWGTEKTRIILILGWAASTVFAPCLSAQTLGADSLVFFSPGGNAGFGQDSLPGFVLGPPRGAGVLEGSLHVVSLGEGGTITISFEDEIVVNGPGPDFSVFENPFYNGGDSLNRYIETAIVEVSQDGVNFLRFPFDIMPLVEPPGNPHRYSGFAGVEPVLSNNGIPDPTDPLVSGGDHFDLEVVGLPNARLVRIIDTGDTTYDNDGDLVTDTGLNLPNQAGFDLDAVCHVHWTARESPFRVLSARQMSSSVIRIDFSKALAGDLELAQELFSLDGRALSETDTVLRVSDSELEIRLAVPLEQAPPFPVLDVSQAIESEGGENLLDPYEREIEPPLGVDENGKKSARDGRTPFSVYPNPFNGSTAILFELSRESEVRASVYDLRGKLVRVLLAGTRGKGVHRIAWDGRNGRGELCPSGVYMVNLATARESSTMKVILRK